MEYIYVKKLNDIGNSLSVFALFDSGSFSISMFYYDGREPRRYERVVDFHDTSEEDDNDDGSSSLEEYMLSEIRKGLSDLFVSRMTQDEWARKFSAKDFADEKWKEADE